jgi:hypothetical protein
VRVDIMFFPSLPLFPLRDLAKGPPSAVILISILKSGSGIPYSSIYAKRRGTASSPQRGEELLKFYFLHNAIIISFGQFVAHDAINHASKVDHHTSGRG